MSLNPLDIIGKIGNAISTVIDELTTTDEEKLEAQRKLATIERDANAAILTYETSLIKQQAETARTEVASSHWLAANWRPLVMLTFTTLMALHWLGVTDAANLHQSEVLALLSIIKLGLGGYVIGRSAEKIVPSAIQAVKQRGNTP